jgi:tetratricopeptide (TPR) repeat protein
MMMDPLPPLTASFSCPTASSDVPESSSFSSLSEEPHNQMMFEETDPTPSSSCSSSTNHPLIGIDDEETSNPVLKQVLNDLKQAEQTYGSNHYIVVDSWNALGLIRIHMQRDVIGARKCHQHALNIIFLHTQNNPTKSSPLSSSSSSSSSTPSSNSLSRQTATTLTDLAYCDERLKRYDIALANYQKALEILTKELSENHPQVISTRRAVTRLVQL